MGFNLLGVGSPLVDYSLAVSDALLSELVPGGKGGTRNIDADTKTSIISRFSGEILRSPGGSAANTLRTFSTLGGRGAFFGKTGSDDDAEFFSGQLKASGVDDSCLLKSDRKATGFCLSLITPDAERTMLSDLSVSREISIEEVEQLNITPFNWLLLEGYLSKEPWVRPLLAKAKKSGCKIALDLNNFELVAREHEHFMQLTAGGIDLLFGNEEEISALFPGKPVSSLPGLLRRHFPMAVLKKGARGALIVTEDEFIDIAAEKCNTVTDTTGAGDFFAAGFFFGMSKNCPLPLCGKVGALCAGAIIGENGTVLPAEKTEILKHNIYQEVEK